MKRRGAVLLFAVAAAVGLSAAPAAAEGSRGWHPRYLVVDREAHHRSCHGTRHPYPTIQEAVDDARRGDTIKVCPGVYRETVMVETPDLTIKGANAGRDATGDDRRRESVVTGDPVTTAEPVDLRRGAVQLLADDIVWDGFKIRDNLGRPGMYTSPDHSGYVIRDTIFRDNGSGIHLGAGGAHPTLVCRNLFVANNEFEGAGGADGIYSSEGARRVLIIANRFERHNNAGIFFADLGADQDEVLIEDNRSVDDLSFATIFNSSRVRIASNHVRARVGDPVFTGPASAIFIGAGNDDIVAHKNRIRSASGNGIDVTNTGGNGLPGPPPTNVVVRKNKVEHAELAGIEVSATGPGEYQVLGNRAVANGTGLHLAPGTSENAVTGNTALDNTVIDCRDETVPVANTWLENVGRTADPADLCAAPTDPDPVGNDGGGKHHGKKHKKHRPDPCRCTLPWRL